MWFQGYEHFSKLIYIHANFHNCENNKNFKAGVFGTFTFRKGDNVKTTKKYHADKTLYTVVQRKPLPQDSWGPLCDHS